jgi:hypothetical protein
VIYEYLHILSENIDYNNHVDIDNSDSSHDTRITDIRDLDIRIHPDICDTDNLVTDGDVDMNANYDNNDDDENKDSDDDRYNINRNKRSGYALAIAGSKRLSMSFHMICNGYRKHGKILEMVKFIEKYGLGEK